MNYYTKIIAVFAFIVVISQGCEFDSEFGDKVGMECLMRQIGRIDEGDTRKAFVFAMDKYFRPNPDTDNMKTSIPLYCNFRENIVNLFMCVVDKMKNCKPQFSHNLDLFVSKKRIVATMKFLCDHKYFLQKSCVEKHYQSVNVCFRRRYSEMKSVAEASKLSHKELIGYACSAFNHVKQCIHGSNGSCSEDFVAFSIEVLERLFPTWLCEPADKKDQIKDEL